MSFIEERPEVNEVYAKLIKAKSSFGKAIKNSINPHFGNKYVDLQSVLDAVTDALLENDLVISQTGEHNGNIFVLRTMLYDSSGDSIDFGVMPIKTIKDDAQSFGSALTYARRYALMSAFGLAPEDDDDGELAGRPMSELEKARLQVIELGKELNQKGYTVEAIKGCLNNVPSQQLTLEEAKEAIGRLNKLLEMEGKA